VKGGRKLNGKKERWDKKKVTGSKIKVGSKRIRRTSGAN